MSALTLTTFPLAELVGRARKHAPFYRRLYADLPDDPSLTDLPVIDQEAFWQAHGTDRREVLTSELTNGIVVKSGGTTGAPKFSYFSDEEWSSILALSCRTYEAAGLQDGDRVANFFATGDLNASFLFTAESLKWARPKVLQLPLGFSLNLAPAAKILQIFEANVLAGFPTHLLKMVDHLVQEKMTEVQIERILYAGELFTSEQQSYLRGIFPKVQFHSAGYASVDAGLVGFADESCTPGEHRMFDDGTIVEILDEDERPVLEIGQPGRVIFTSLTRRLMPLLRYPTGDRAQWVEPAGSPDRKFILLGRSEEAVRVAIYTVVVSEAEALLEPFRATYGIEQFQLLSTREDLQDRLTFRVAASAPAEKQAEGTEAILAAFHARRPDFANAVAGGMLQPTQIDWITARQLITSERTGKLLRIVDRRGV